MPLDGFGPTRLMTNDTYDVAGLKATRSAGRLVRLANGFNRYGVRIKPGDAVGSQRTLATLVEINGSELQEHMVSPVVLTNVDGKICIDIQRL